MLCVCACVFAVCIYASALLEAEERHPACIVHYVWSREEWLLRVESKFHLPRRPAAAGAAQASAARYVGLHHILIRLSLLDIVRCACTDNSFSSHLICPSTSGMGVQLSLQARLSWYRLE